MKSPLIAFGLSLYLCLASSVLANQQPTDNHLSLEQAREIVTNIYHDKLAREPDAEGLELHMKILLEEGKDAAWLARALGDSEEGRLISRSKRQTRLGITFVILGSLLFWLLIWLLNKRVGWSTPILYFLWIYLLLESVIRIYFVSVLRVDFFRPEDAAHLMLLSNYVVSAEQKVPETLKSSKGYRVLLLGASVLDPNHGRVPQYLRSHLQTLGANNIEIVNYARASHSTRDSRFKYLQLLKNYQFDIVVVYHAINDVRANNCPEDVFKSDYSHYAWYEDLNIMERHSTSVHFSAIPFVGDFLFHRLRQRIFPRRYIPIGEPPPDWISYGARLKTISSFRKNIEDIIATARSRSTKIILITFATYLPPSYSMDSYANKKLDYANEKGFPVELWGNPANVVRGVEAHNKVIRDLAAKNPEVILLDIENIIPKEGKYFADICHLSSEDGSKALAFPVAELLMKQFAQ